MPDSRTTDHGPCTGTIARFFKAPEWGLVAGILGGAGLIYFLDRDRAFFQPYSLQTLLHRVALFGVLAVGAAHGDHRGRDRSLDRRGRRALVGRQRQAVDRMAAPRRCGRRRPPSDAAVVALAIGLTLLMGLAIGLVHAFMINGLRLPPFIATLATMAGLRSLATVLSPEPDDQRLVRRVSGAGEGTVGDAVDLRRAWPSSMSILMGWTVLGRHFRPGRQRDGRAAERPADPAAQGRRVRPIRDASALGGILFTGLQRPGRQPAGRDLRADRHHGGRGGRLQPLGRRRLDPRHGPGAASTQIVIKGTGIVVRGIDSTQIEGLVLGTVVLLAVAFNQHSAEDEADVPNVPDSLGTAYSTVISSRRS